MVGEVES